MKPLIVLVSVFSVSIYIIKLITQKYELHLAAKIGMCTMLLFTATGHFVYTKGMELMIPTFIPLKTEIIYLTGLIEILIGICLLIPKLSVCSGWVLIAFFMILLPANIYGAINHINYQKANFDGNGLNYLWFRIPLQFVFIVWTYISTIKN